MTDGYGNTHQLLLRTNFSWSVFIFSVTTWSRVYYHLSSPDDAPSLWPGEGQLSTKYIPTRSSMCHPFYAWRISSWKWGTRTCRMIPQQFDFYDIFTVSTSLSWSWLTSVAVFVALLSIFLLMLTNKHLNYFLIPTKHLVKYYLGSNLKAMR
jgi:hypothetical protein